MSYFRTQRRGGTYAGLLEGFLLVIKIFSFSTLLSHILQKKPEMEIDWKFQYIMAKNFKHPPVLNIELLKWINSVKHIMNKYLKVLGGLYYGKELYIQLLTTSNPMRYFRAQSLCTEWVRGYRRVTNIRLSTPFQGQVWYNKPLQGMAPTECLLSACVLPCLTACLHACLLAFSPACLPACLLACLLACLPDCLPACLLVCLLS